MMSLKTAVELKPPDIHGPCFGIKSVWASWIRLVGRLIGQVKRTHCLRGMCLSLPTAVIKAD